MASSTFSEVENSLLGTAWRPAPLPSPECIALESPSRFYAMRPLTFTQVDVFTRRPLEGNPLAVFHSGAGLSTARMQAIAREMNLSETTFLFPPGRGADARVRIFTTEEELPFAGHPTLGTAFVVSRRKPAKTVINLQMKVGIIPVRVRRASPPAFLEMRQKDPLFGPRLEDRGALATTLGIRPSELDPRYAPQVVSTGVPFLIVPLRGSPTLARVRPDEKLLRRLLGPHGAFQPYFLVTGEPTVEARMLFHGVEDPATGSAAGCAAAYLVACGRWPPDATLVIRQGRLAHRPSRISVAASLDGERVHNVRVGGHVVEVLEGKLRL